MAVGVWVTVGVGVMAAVGVGVGQIAADYYSAMSKVERQLAWPEDQAKEPPKLGELIALTDALRNGFLNPTQTEIVRALREGLGLLEDVKVQSAPLDKVAV